jgi:hypothetical protein
MKAKAKLPTIEISAGAVSEAAEGSSATMTPQKPTTIAHQRRQPTCSPSRKGDSAAT